MKAAWCADVVRLPSLRSSTPSRRRAPPDSLPWALFQASSNVMNVGVWSMAPTRATAVGREVGRASGRRTSPGRPASSRTSSRRRPSLPFSIRFPTRTGLFRTMRLSLRRRSTTTMRSLLDFSARCRPSGLPPPRQKRLLTSSHLTTSVLSQTPLSANCGCS